MIAPKSDRLGNRVTAASALTVTRLDKFVDEVLSHGKEAAQILEAAADDPEAPLAQAYAGLIYLFLQTPEGRTRATPHVTAANAAAARGTEREQRFVAAVDAWWRGDADLALDLHIRLAVDYPRDALNLKLMQVHQINCGDRLRMRERLTAALPAARDIGYVWGLYAYALEQNGCFDAAEMAGHHAVSLNVDDPWAHHAVGHVMEMQGRLDEGMAWMRRHGPRWDRCSSFLYTHNWWHTALLHLDRDEPEGALTLFDERVWGVRKGHVQDQVNAVALLARLELNDVDVGSRWLDVGQHLVARVDDHQNGFLDLHFLYGLARAGNSDAVAALMAGIDRQARSSDASAPLWRDIALPAARGLLAFVEGDARRAADRLGAVHSQLYRLGGSNAQRDLFEQVYLRALLQTCNAGPARDLIAERLQRRAMVPWEHRTMATALDQLDHGGASAVARHTAESLSRRYREARGASC